MDHESLSLGLLELGLKELVSFSPGMFPISLKLGKRMKVICREMED